jgi:CO/xanthine dehydrogenase Mo-binding subunit
MRSPGGKLYVSRAAAAPHQNRAAELPVWRETAVVGKPLSRIDAYERVSGAAIYTLDMALPEMLHAAILRCPHAHARFRSVDTSRAERTPGVWAVLTGKSPGSEIPFYPGPDGKSTSRLFDSHCRYEGDEVAAVAAETLEIANEALRQIRVDYEVLSFVSSAEAAVAAGAVQIHNHGNVAGEPNIYERGDIAGGFREAAVVREHEYRTSCQIHTPLETHVSIAHWEGTRLTVWDSTQGVYDTQALLAQTLALPLTCVRVISQFVGGGFGSKGDELNKHTIIAALLSRISRRPVKAALSREEGFLCVGNRPAGRLWLKAGIRRDGALIALHMKLFEEGGAYVQQYPGQIIGYLSDLYACPNVRAEEHYFHINAGTGRPFRAPGYPQAAWALEQTMDDLAEAIGFDPVEIRLKNVPLVSQIRNGKPYTSTGLADCLSRGAQAFGWAEKPSPPRSSGGIKRGVGVACCNWGYPGEALATAVVKVFGDGSVNLNTGASDIGTGTKTILAMIVAEDLGVPLSSIQVEHADTATSQYAPISGGSQTVVSNAPAVRAAATAARRQIMEMAAQQLNLPLSSLVLRDGKIISTDGARSLAIGDLKQLRPTFGATRGVIVGVGQREPHPPGKVGLPFAAHFAEVEVNTRTGEVRVIRLLGAHDSGRVMNQLTYENQVFGGMTMGIGFALTEKRVLDARQTGKMVNANWHDYKIPTAKDVPLDHLCLAIDPRDSECNNTGAKGLGEPALIPTAAAIANAVYHATGIRVTEAPITPMQMLALLHKQRSSATEREENGDTRWL